MVRQGRILVVLLTAVSVWGLSCAPDIVSPNSAVWSHGTLYATSSKDLAAVYEAAVTAVESLELNIEEKAKDVFAAKVVAKGADGKSVTIYIEPEGDMTAYKISVGMIGGKESRARMIHEAMRKNMGM
jgi:hypothetical protein